MLDAELLTRQGMTSARVIEGDALFFFQLLAPMCDVEGGKSGIHNDRRRNFFVPHARWTNTYMTQMNPDNLIGYGHELKHFSVMDLVRWWGVVLMDGVRGGSHHVIELQWNLGRKAYDADIAIAMSFERWKQGKWNVKFCNNRTDAYPRTHQNYDPAYKYKFLTEVLCYNTNYLIQTF